MKPFPIRKAKMKREILLNKSKKKRGREARKQEIMMTKAS